MLVNTPPMGWNTWNTFGKDINEDLIRESADKFVELGLAKAGYQYIVIDDCWSEKDRDPKTHRILASKEKFPHGMKAVADYVHAKGLKFGMYSCAGIRTCADYPGSFDHEFLDAETFAEFGCDYLKYDFCFKPDSTNGPMLYHRMGNALRRCGRDILFAACNWGSDDVWSWIRSTGAHMYRSTVDINDSFKSFMDIAQSQIPKLASSAPQCFNDLDMLTVGMYGKGLVGGLNSCTYEEYRIQFSLWCMMNSPLMLGCDIRKMTPEIVKLVTNPGLIAINQDPECRQPWITTGYWRDPQEVFVMAKMLSDGDLAIMFCNLKDKQFGVPFSAEMIGFPFAAGYNFEFTSVFDDEKFVVEEFLNKEIAPRSCEVYRVKPVRRA